MDDPFSRGFPFDLTEVWRLSTFNFENEAETLFEPIDGHLPELELGSADKLYRPELDLPELAALTGIGDVDLNKVESELASTVTSSPALDDPTPGDLPDVWTLEVDAEDRKALPVLHTWEAFERQDAPNAERTAYLSEAGPRVFDSALRLLENETAGIGVLPQDVMLRALCNLALGRSSLFFQWDEGKKRFVPTLGRVPISGFSSTSTESLAEDMVDFGSTYKFLNEYMTATTRGLCPTGIAFNGCVNDILNAVEQHITRSLSGTSSILQLQRLIERPRQLLRILKHLTRSVAKCSVDEDFISSLSDDVHRLASADSCFSEVLRVVLSRVSAPWLEHLCSHLGLSTARAPFPETSRESTEEAAKDEDSSFGLQVRGNESLPSLVSSADRALITETKANVKLLRQYLPESPITATSFVGSALPPWNGGSLDAFPAFGTKSVQSSEANPTKLVGNLDVSFDKLENTAFTSPAQPSDGHVWADPDVQHAYLDGLNARMSQPIELQIQPSGSLQNLVTDALEDNDFKTKIEGLAQDFSPLERLRPIVQWHARTINRTLLRHLFWNCNLRHHLDLQRQYHLLGNGDFISRLTTALFSTETQSTERKRGTVPTGDIMGLRLGARDGQRWPPASSELRLALMGVLTETYHPQAATETKALRSKELPGGLSFSIRELPDKDIDRVMDRESMYALDFLRLQYTAPACVDAVLTPSVMQAYDDIFRFLLRLFRLLHVTTRLQSPRLGDNAVPHQRWTSSGVKQSLKRRFVIEAHYVLCILMSYVMDIGIQGPWQRFLSSMTAVEEALHADDENHSTMRSPSAGLVGLCELHRTCLESIRNRLFLRQRQEKIRDAIEQLLTDVLKCSSALERDELTVFESGVGAFERSITELLDILSNAVDKPAKLRDDVDKMEADTDALRVLMTRLNWNGFL